MGLEKLLRFINSLACMKPGKNYSSFLDFPRNYERTGGIFVPSIGFLRTLADERSRQQKL